MMEHDYPEEFIRGVPKKSDQFITPEGYPTQAVFLFDDYCKERNDGFQELSINWVDDEGAVEVLLNQINTRKGCIQFEGGYCRLSRLGFHSLSVYFDNGHISYERKPIEGNPERGIQANKYHGNLLMKNEISRQAKINIQVALAVMSGIVIKREIS